LVLEIVVDPARIRVDLRELRFAAERDRRDHFATRRLDHGRGLAAAVERIDFTAARLEEDRIGVLARLDLAERFQRNQIHDTDLVFTAVARETAPELRRERKA